VPTICIPQLWQQFTYARFAEKRGCGRVIDRGQLSAARLSEAVREVLRDERYSAAAREAGAVITREGGAALARQLIERWFQGVLGEAQSAA
jgi:UDP:flavonoid glycosyltransferase YjiC (YdhE family)